MKEMSNDAIDIGSFLISSFTVVSLTTDRGYFLVTGSFLVCCYTILSETLSNWKVFRLATVQALEGMKIPNPSFPRGKYPPVRGDSFYNHYMSMSMGEESLFIASSYCFL